MGNYAIPEETTQKLQLISLEMLRFFDAFCAQHNLTYFLCGGCCIGAIRHEGFIPWDDDVDVFMPREDYERLKKVWTDTEQYEIEYADNKRRCNSTSIRICDKNTTFIRTYTVNKDVSHSVSMDVFPLDGCPSGFKRRIQKLEALLYSLYIVENAPENHGPLVKVAGKLALTLVPSWKMRCKIWKHCEKKMSQYKISDCDYVTELCAGPGYMQNEYSATAFSKAIRHRFEDGEYPIPVGYDHYLRMAFGDYMQLPPEEKRIAHHEYEFIDLNNGYRQYRGTKYLIGKKSYE